MNAIASAKPNVIAASRASRWDSADLHNVGLLLSCFACVALLVPPMRAYPMDDDWIYAQSVTGLLNWTYKPHQWSMTLAFSHNIWGAIFSTLFGESFTTLSIANLVMSA